MNACKRLLFKIGYVLIKIYWFIFRPRTQGVRCILTKNGSILLIQHSYGSNRWSIPGGGIKRSESPAEAAKREIAEEVGIAVSGVNNLGYVFYDAEYKKDTIWVFQAEVSSDEFNIDGLEISNAQWFPIDSLPKNSSGLLPRFISLYLLQSPNFTPSSS